MIHVKGHVLLFCQTPTPGRTWELTLLSHRNNKKNLAGAKLGSALVWLSGWWLRVNLVIAFTNLINISESPSYLNRSIWAMLAIPDYMYLYSVHTCNNTSVKGIRRQKISQSSIILTSLVTGRLPDTLTNMVERTSMPDIIIIKDDWPTICISIMIDYSVTC